MVPINGLVCTVDVADTNATPTHGLAAFNVDDGLTIARFEDRILLPGNKGYVLPYFAVYFPPPPATNPKALLSGAVALTGFFLTQRPERSVFL